MCSILYPSESLCVCMCFFAGWVSVLGEDRLNGSMKWECGCLSLFSAKPTQPLSLLCHIRLSSGPHTATLCSTTATYQMFASLTLSVQFPWDALIPLIEELCCNHQFPQFWDNDILMRKTVQWTASKWILYPLCNAVFSNVYYFEL